MGRRQPHIFEAKVEKLVYGGQGLATLEDGRKAFIWNSLPDEIVKFRTTKIKKSYVEGVAFEIIDGSKYRVKPHEDFYLSTSPWQIIDYIAENQFKETTLQEALNVGQLTDFYSPEQQWNYRNKMEYSFYGNESGLHLALYNRGTHHKQIVTGSALADEEIDLTANKILKILKDKQIRAGDLKSLIIRCNHAGDTLAALFTKKEDIAEISELQSCSDGLTVYYSDPKSPASIATKKLFQYGQTVMSDKILDREIKYDALSFFQVNIQPYQKSLKIIKKEVEGFSVTDFYSGVGSIGLTVSTSPVKLIEIDDSSVKMANLNQRKNDEVIQSSTEKALEYLPSGANNAVIFDPPRAGLHKKVIEQLLINLPEKVIYLSCNPATLARDLDKLKEKYKIKTLNGFNFFPKTPHIEALATLVVK